MSSSAWPASSRGSSFWSGYLPEIGSTVGRSYFLRQTVATSVSGFLFPFHGLSPAIVTGIISSVVLAVAIYARYARLLTGGWRKTYVISAVVALYLNVFVLIVQSFQKMPALNALAPKQTEPPFAITQLLVLALFIVLGVLAASRFRSEPTPATQFN